MQKREGERGYGDEEERSKKCKRVGRQANKEYRIGSGILVTIVALTALNTPMGDRDGRPAWSKSCPCPCAASDGLLFLDVLLVSRVDPLEVIVGAIFISNFCTLLSQWFFVERAIVHDGDGPFDQHPHLFNGGDGVYLTSELERIPIPTPSGSRITVTEGSPVVGFLAVFTCRGRHGGAGGGELDGNDADEGD